MDCNLCVCRKCTPVPPTGKWTVKAQGHRFLIPTSTILLTSLKRWNFVFIFVYYMDICITLHVTSNASSKRLYTSMCRWWCVCHCRFVCVCDNCVCVHAFFFIWVIVGIHTCLWFFIQNFGLFSLKKKSKSGLAFTPKIYIFVVVVVFIYTGF